MNRPDRAPPSGVPAHSPLAVLVVALVAYGVVTHQPLLWTLVAIAVAVAYAGYRALRSRQ